MQLPKIAAVIALLFFNCQFAAAQFNFAPPTPPFTITTSPPVEISSTSTIVRSDGSRSASSNIAMVRVKYIWQQMNEFGGMDNYQISQEVSVDNDGTWSVTTPIEGRNSGIIGSALPFVTGRNVTWGIYSKTATGDWTYEKSGTMKMGQ